ncbi:hypothetical protein ACFCX4_02135 [Kitasatospora sp. NPDC056327]|uniref:hypothetical protein n=1 Tax=Kitasatospora sp. NPDC056327 TaxID=3345785 RepID=UPI0035DA7502
MSSHSVSEVPALTVTVHTQEEDGSTGQLLGYGLLTSTRTVLVPNPVEPLADPWRRFVARISRPPGGAANTVSVPVGGISTAALDGDGIVAAAAVLTLVREESYPVAVVSATKAQLGAALRQYHGDQWATYAHLGFQVVPPAQVGPADTWWRGQSAAGAGVSADAVTYAAKTCCSSRVCC